MTTAASDRAARTAAAPIASPGTTMAVDWEQRVNFDRLRDYRTRRIAEALEATDLGALLLFDTNNIRYSSSTKVGSWDVDRHARWVLVPRGHDLVSWDFGSAARHHQLFCPWLPEENWQAGVAPMRGTMSGATPVPAAFAASVAETLRELGLEGEPVGADVLDMTAAGALREAGVEVVDGTGVMLEARKIKSADELALLDHAAAIVDATYEVIFEELRPGVRESELVARAMKRLYELGSEHVEAINAISGERCSPHPHTFSDRLLRPGDQAFFDVMHSFMGYRTCYYRTFNVGSASRAQVEAYKRCRDWLDASIDVIKPGATTDQVAAVWPEASEFGFPDERSAFALQFGHGLGVGVFEHPMISRYHSFEAPMPIEEGMCFALETYCPASDGVSAARIEEEVIVTADGNRVISRFPAGDLLVAGRVSVGGFPGAGDAAQAG